MIDKKYSDSPITPGHRACAGCGLLIAARTVMESVGKDVIVANATGCLEVTTTPYPNSAWNMPWIHSLFENASSVASGIQAALNYKNKKKKIKVIAQGGDGATFDIGFGQISGMWDRKDDVVYVCYDNEAYCNTGVQSSGATPWGANTTTTPKGSHPDSFGSEGSKKDMISVALAHGLKYVAQSTVAYVDDIKKKIKKALEISGPSYIQVLVPCVPGWKIESNQVIKIAKLANQTGLYPLLEYEDGELSNVVKSKDHKSVHEYLSLQGRFKHLIKDQKKIDYIQSLANKNIDRYSLSF